MTTNNYSGIKKYIKKRRGILTIKNIVLFTFLMLMAVSIGYSYWNTPLRVIGTVTAISSSGNIITDTTTTTYDPSNVPSDSTIIYTQIAGEPQITTDSNGNVVSFEYTDTGNGVSFSTGNSLNTGVIAFDGEPFTIHLEFTITTNSNNTGKFILSALSHSNGSNYGGFVFYSGSTSYFYINASKKSKIQSTGFGTRIFSGGWRVNPNTTTRYTLDILYTPAPSKSLSVTCTPVASGSSSYTSTSTNLDYIPDTLAGATITIGGSGVNTSNDTYQMIVHEFSVSKT